MFVVERTSSYRKNASEDDTFDEAQESRRFMNENDKHTFFIDRSAPSLIVSGKRSLNGIPVDAKTLSSLSAYVQQDDLFIGTLTVREHLIFQVRDIILRYIVLRYNILVLYRCSLS